MEKTMKGLLILSAVASASLAVGLDAQVPAPKADSTCTNYPDGRVECRVYRRGAPGDSLLHNRIFYKMDSAMAKRAALGLQLRTTGTRRDTLGVFVEAVTPKGPAETAGIIEGDRIAAINGVDLRTSAADTEDSYTNGLAAHRLTREVQKLVPGARVTLRVYSGGRFRDVQVTAGKASDVMRLGTGFRFGMPGMGMMQFDGPGTMMFGPDMKMLRDRMPMIRKQLEPLLRERLNGLPDRTQFRTAPRIRTTAPVRVRVPRTYRVDRGGEEFRAAEAGQAFSPENGDVLLDERPEIEEPFIFDELFELDQPFILDFDEPFEFENEIEPVSPEVIRELAATAVQDARVALKQLAADGIV
jgi:hypothetical protein